MASGEATLSRKNQIVIPKEAREALGLKPGDKLLVVVHGKTLTIVPKPKSFSKAMFGIARDVYPPGYLERERRSWKRA
jgi:AbrB family looped-hinge helix DNA binding protein